MPTFTEREVIMNHSTPLKPTVLMDHPGAGYHIPLPQVTGNKTQNRLVMQAYRRLQSRLARGNQTTEQLTDAVDQYRRVVTGILGPRAMVVFH